jgi:hydrogenase-4 component B
MGALFSAILLIFGGGLLSLLLHKRHGLQTLCGAGGAMAGSCIGLFVALHTLVTGTPVVWHGHWSMPLGAFSITLDALSAFFLVPLFIVSFFGALYAIEYLRGTAGTGMQWFFYNLLVAGMAMVVVSSNGLLFLLSWETMSLASFVLVLYKHKERESREAAWIYLIATHIGSAFLIVFFLLAGSAAGSLEFSDYARHGFPPVLSGVLFITCLVGFGAKAGFVPFHVWLPRAHPAAPSHVSALMSGIMIKMGIYGILRALTFIGPIETWWGVLLVAIGCVSGVLGVLLALGQHDLKRLLAYHSVENIGIIALGIGIGMIGVSCHIPLLAVLGFCGGMLHIVNHAFFKGLLFFGAGSVLHATGTAQIDRLGGLIKKMPSTAVCFLVGSIAICGLPPLNGFVSEFFIYCAGFFGQRNPPIPVFVCSALSIASLALIGGLATACFTKAFGTVFLGEARQGVTARHEAGMPMKITMYSLGVLCLAIGLLFWLVIDFMTGPLSLVTQLPAAEIRAQLSPFIPSLRAISAGGFLFVMVAFAVYLLRKKLLGKRQVTASPTWDCGYIKPTPRMQYTASSFAQPIVSFFRMFLFPKRSLQNPPSDYPEKWAFHSHVGDFFLDIVYVPFMKRIEAHLSRLRWVQGGRVHWYVLYIAATLVALVIWNLVWKK